MENTEVDHLGVGVDYNAHWLNHPILLKMNHACILHKFVI